MSKFSVQFWGVRGLLPASKPLQVVRSEMRELLLVFAKIAENLKGTAEQKIDTFIIKLPNWKSGGSGGDTSCVEVLAGDTRMIIGAGSRLRRLGEKLMQGRREKGQGEAHLFFTNLFFMNFHWNHIIGLPFFSLTFETLRSKIKFHKIESREKMQPENLDITPYELDHSNACWGYRAETGTWQGRKAYAHRVHNKATRISPVDLGRDNEISKSADFCFSGSQYTLHKFFPHMNWGARRRPLGASDWHFARGRDFVDLGDLKL